MWPSSSRLLGPVVSRVTGEWRQPTLTLQRMPVKLEANPLEAFSFEVERLRFRDVQVKAAQDTEIEIAWGL